MKKDKILIDGKKFDSRLIMGTSLYPNIDVLNKSIEISECEIVTISMRRFNSTKKLFFDQLLKKITFLPNTAGCFTKKEAI